jgi:hypothetical protein
MIVFRKNLITVLMVVIIYGCGGGGEGNTPPPVNNTPPVNNPPLPSQPPAATSFPQSFDQGVVYQAELYVSSMATPGGDGSQSSPYNNIREALSNATAGTRINIDAGNYSPIGTVTNLQGTAQAPISLVANGTVIIDGNNAVMALHLIDARYLVIDGLTIQNTFPHGINIDDGGDYVTPSENIVLRNMHIRNVGNGGNNDCLKMSGVNNFYIEYSEFENCNSGEAIDLVGSHDGVISGNYFHDMPINAINTKGGSANVLIHGNRFVDVSQRAVNAGGSTGTPFFRPINATYEGRNIQILANIFVRTGSAPVAFVGCDTCVFANNTVIEPQRYVARILEENTSRTAGGNGFFINNIIVFNTSQVSTFVNVGPGTNPATFTFGSNLWYALDDSNFNGPSYGAGIPPETNSVIQQNPNLGMDYRISAASPAVGRGREVPRGLAGDYDRRAYNTPPSIGAFEEP